MAIRALKVYLFVLALVFLGTGFMPVVDKYLVHVPAAALYWVNIVSAILDNATLTAAEITPAMSVADDKICPGRPFDSRRHADSGQYTQYYLRQ